MNEIRSWTRRDAAETYNVNAWGAGYFHVNDAGHIQVTPDGPEGPSVDLHDLVTDLRARGIGMPLLIRFSDILHSRVRTICSSFAAAIQEYGFKGKPGDVKRLPRQYAPYHLRLDWLMWFAALSPAYARGWFEPFVTRLLANDPATLRLLRHNPFPERPPTHIRARLYEYRFTTRAERRETGAWWHREPAGVFLSPVARADRPAHR